MIADLDKELEKLQNRLNPITPQIIDEMNNTNKEQMKFLDDYATTLFGVEKVENGYFYEGHKLASIYIDNVRHKLVGDVFLFVYRESENALLEKSFTFVLENNKDVTQFVTLIQIAHHELYSFVYKDEEEADMY